MSGASITGQAVGEFSKDWMPDSISPTNAAAIKFRGMSKVIQGGVEMFLRRLRMKHVTRHDGEVIGSLTNVELEPGLLLQEQALCRQTLPD